MCKPKGEREILGIEDKERFWVVLEFYVLIYLEVI